MKSSDRDPGNAEVGRPLRVVVLCIALSWGSGCGGAWESEASGLASGAPDPTLIDVSTLSGLQEMTVDGNYRLTADIDARATAGWSGGLGFVPIEFAGMFDGNGFTISDLTIHRPEESFVGLFSRAAGAVLRNVRLTRVNITGRSQVGGLVGQLSDSEVRSSFVEGNVTASAGSFQGVDVGLLAGIQYGGTTTRSSANGTVSGWASNVGGFIGTVVDGFEDRAHITECYAQAIVAPDTQAPTLPVIAGGLIGYANSVDLHDVYALGSVTGRGAVGGIVGQLGSSDALPSSFSTSYSRNTVEDANVAGWAGVCGGLKGKGARLEGLFWDNTVDDGPHSSTSGHQSGRTTTALTDPTSTHEGIYGGGLGSDWDDTVWDAGSADEYNALRHVAGASEQVRQ